MLRVTDASPLAVTIPFVDSEGEAITPTAATWRLLDQDENEIDAGTAVLQQDQIAVLIAGANNQISDTRAARCLRVTFDTATGPVVIDTYYLVTKLTTLTVLQNSFQTYAQALVLRESFGGLLAGWDVATPREQASALEHAFHKIARMAFRVTPDDPTRFASFEDDEGYGVAWLVTDIKSMPLDQYLALNARFRSALTRAQMLEADNLLGGDVVGKRRQDGILSETTGESSMMFNSRPALDLPICRDAHRELSGYVYRRVGLTRG